MRERQPGRRDRRPLATCRVLATALVLSGYELAPDHLGDPVSELLKLLETQREPALRDPSICSKMNGKFKSQRGRADSSGSARIAHRSA